jgi:hypothetical protein
MLTKLDSKAIVGFQIGGKAWIAEGDHFVSAYHKLYAQVVSR